MSYHVNDIFLTVQGEGANTGRAAVFCRFSRCNLWTGREADRPRAACRFCDTEFTAATALGRDGLLDAITSAWRGADNPMVVFTGGEPALQLDQHITEPLKAAGWFTAIETNGTRPLPPGLDWVCVSPKADTNVVVTEGDELKVVWPQPFDLDTLWYATQFDHYWLSPMDGPELTANTEDAVERVLADPRWRLNIQVHKLIGVR